MVRPLPAVSLHVTKVQKNESACCGAGEDRSPTVLIVDDDSEVTATFARWLRAERYDVRTAGDGETALSMIQGADVLIVDMRMPILDGLAFLRRARAIDARVPAAVVTGDYLMSDETLKELAALGARVVLKPLWLDDLVALAVSMVNGAAA